MGARFGFAGGEGAVAFDRGMTDMEVVEREKEVKTTTPSADATGAYQPSTFNTLVYPLDLVPENFYPEAIRFNVTKRVGIKLEKLQEYMDAAGGLAKDEYIKLRGTSLLQPKTDEPDQKKEESGFLDKLGEAADVVGDATAATSTGVKSFVGMIRDDMNAQTKLRVDGTTQNTLGSIYLNMPNNIQFNENVNWNGQELGWVGSMLDNEQFSDFNLGAGAPGNMGNIVSGGMGAVVGKLLNTMGVSSSNMMLGGLMGAISQGGKIQGAMENAVSSKSNPYMEMLFQGVDFRRFSFNFMMRPRNEDEVKQVEGIIKMFRLHSRPSWTPGIFGASQGFMKFPQEFHISFLTMEKGFQDNTKSRSANKFASDRFVQNSALPQLKPCVCTGVETNYTPQSIWAAFRHGKPIAISLTVNFAETELVMAQDIASNY